MLVPDKIYKMPEQKLKLVVTERDRKISTHVGKDSNRTDTNTKKQGCGDREKNAATAGPLTGSQTHWKHIVYTLTGDHKHTGNTLLTLMGDHRHTGNKWRRQKV